MNDTTRHTARMLLLARDVAKLRMNATRYPVRHAADKLATAFDVAIRAAFASARKKLPNIGATIHALESALEKVLPALLQRGLVEGAQAALTQLRGAELRTAKITTSKRAIAMKFDATNPHAVKWAKRYAAELVTEISKTTRDRLKLVVTKHTAGLIDDADYRDALEAVVADLDRAQLIARTESMRVVHQGQREAWHQAVDQGLLKKSAKRVWIVTADDRLCPICEPLEDKKASLDGTYASGYDAPPAHPNCRCTEGLA